MIINSFQETTTDEKIFSWLKDSYTVHNKTKPADIFSWSSVSKELIFRVTCNDKQAFVYINVKTQAQHLFVLVKTKLKKMKNLHQIRPADAWADMT